MRPRRDGFTAKEVNAPTAILRVADKRQPGRPSGSRLRSIVLGQDTANHVLVDLDAEGSRDDQRDTWAAEA